MAQTINSSQQEDLHPLLTKEGHVVYMLNGCIADDTNNEQTGFVSNCPSNELCYNFVHDYKGHVKINKDRVVIFEGDDNMSQIVLLDTNSCTSKIILRNKCLNFQDKLTGRYRLSDDGTIVYFGNKNRLNFLNIDKCPELERINSCDECQTLEGEFNCQSLEFYGKVNLPKLNLKEINGNIPNGSYQVAIGFTDQGSLRTEYFIYPELIKLFDRQYRTSGISIEFDCINSSFDEYEIILISYRDDRAVSAQSIGKYDISQRNLSITNLDSPLYSPLDLSQIYQRGVYYQGAEILVENSESLILGKPCYRIPFDYRPQSNEIEVEVVAMSVKKEEAHLYTSLMRDEVYAVDISWTHLDGEETSRYHIPAKAETTIFLDTTYNMTDDAPANPDHYELGNTGCNSDPRKVFEIYNNSTLEVTTFDCENCQPTELGSGKPSYWESQELYPEDYPDFGCTPIKHHKMPDNCKVPIVNNDCVIVLGLRLKNVQKPIDCDGNEVEVLGYNVYISKRENHKSILHKGLIYNMGIDDSRDCEEIMYPNFPFNDLNPNKFLSNKWRKGIFTERPSNYLDRFSDKDFTYHSPDIHYIKGAEGTTLNIYSEAIGKIQGRYHYTEDYPKFQILSGFGNLITQLAGFVETAINLNGTDTKKTTLEKTCVTKPERTETVSDFPVNQQTGGTVTVNGTLPPGQTGGPFTENHTINYNNNIVKESYTIKSEADPDCTNFYTAFNLSTEEGSNLSDIPLVNLGTEEGHKCYVFGNSNAPDGTAVTLCFNSNSLDPTETGERHCHSGTVLDGEFKIEIPMNCGDAFGAVGVLPSQFSFNPECECTGDQIVTSTHEETNEESKIDFISRLPDLSRLPATIYYYMQGQSATNTFLKALLKPTNYAVQYTSEAEYDVHYPVCRLGNRRRELLTQRYLQPINQIVNGNYINNWSRENSDYIELGDDISRPINDDLSRILHSELCEAQPDDDQGNPVDDKNCKGVSFNYGLTLENEPVRNVQAVSYYVGVTQYQPSQYGNLNGYNSRKVSFEECKESLESDVIYAGDIYITKMSVKRKMPLFKKLPLGLPNNIDWDMRDYPNVAYPTYWLNTSQESIIEDIFETTLPGLGQALKDYSLDAVEGLGECYSSITKAVVTFQETLGGIFGTLGIITTLTGLLTGDFINPLKLNGIFYTHVTGIASFWCESEFQSSYREVNELKQSHFYPELDLEDLALSTEYSLPEQFLYNLHYNYLGISKDTIRLNEFDCCTVENNIIAYSLKNNEDRLGDEWLNFKPLNYHKFTNKDGALTTIKEIDDYNLFIGFEDASYVTQMDEGLVTTQGNTLFIGSPNAFQRRLKKISTDSSGYGGIIDPDGAVMSRYGLIYPDRKRKKWLLYNGQLTDITGTISSWSQEFMNSPIKGVYDNLSDQYYFSSNDWTRSYKPKNQDWISFHSFIPDTYETMSNNFLSLKRGWYKHNVKNNYQTYYGKVYPFEVGILVKSANSQLQDVHVFTEWYKSMGYDTKIYKKEFFDQILIYNNCGSTGIQDITIQEDNYIPVHLIDKVLVSNKNCDEWALNNITNNALNQPYVYRNKDGYTYTSSSIKKKEIPLNGRWFKIHLISNNKPNLKKLVEITLTKLDPNYV